MNDRFIDVELLGNTIYGVENIENSNLYNIEFIDKHYNTIEQEGSLYNILELPITKHYGVAYCIKYRPLGMSEWILQRGRRNDRGLWTEDGIFNDGKI